MSLATHLTTLEQSGLIHRLPLDEIEYLFRHALVQDAAYASLLKTDRRVLHRQVGATLEQLYTDRLDELAPTLARHYAEADERALAHTYYVRAGDHALANYANIEAEALYRQALALNAPLTDAEHAYLLRRLGESLFRQDYEIAAIETWREAITLYAALNDASAVGGLYASSIRAAWNEGRNDLATALAEQGLQACARDADSVGLAELLHEAGRFYHFVGQPNQAFPLCQRALQIAEKFDVPRVYAEALTTFAILPRHPIETRIQLLTRAVEICETHALLFVGCRAHNNLAESLSNSTGDLQAAATHMQRAMEMAERMGSVGMQRFFAANRLTYLMDLGQLEAAAQALQHTTPSKSPDSLLARTGQAQFLSYHGHFTDALALWRECQAEAQSNQQIDELSLIHCRIVETWSDAVAQSQTGRPVYLAPVATVPTEILETMQAAVADGKNARSTVPVWAQSLLGMLSAVQGRFAEAHELLAEIEASLGPTVQGWERQALYFAQARLAAAEGHTADTDYYFQLACAGWEHMGARWFLARGLSEWAAVAAHRGDVPQARHHLTDALNLFRAMNIPLYVAWLEARLAQL